MPKPITSFPPEVADQLKTYVYRLIDPRNGETFYIGKGVGDRVFAHSRAETKGDDTDGKLHRIREIRLAGFEVSHVIHRHGLNSKTAFEVEAALIDSYPGLTNLVAGLGSNSFGPMHAQEILTRYAAKTADFSGVRALLINVSRSAGTTSLYEATRYAWKINPVKARRAEVILAVMQGLIRGAFTADRWLEANPENFPQHPPLSPGRYAFVGRSAPRQIQSRFVGKRIPDTYRKRGAANPIKYTW
ncbi:MAG: hypothetical protein AAGG38_03330 [Planctomycetota bacterium]